MSSLPKQAIVLAAGLGTRLRPLTLRIPKPALPVGGAPILLYNLFLLKEAGVDRITLNLHHRPEVIRRLLDKGRPLGLKLGYSYEPKILGTAGGIAQALDGLDGSPTFILNGDILMDLDLKAMAAEHFRVGAQATLACVGKEKAPVTSFVEYDKLGRIWRIAGNPARIAKSSPPFEKGGSGGISPKSGPKLTSAIFSGAHLLDPKLFADYPRGRFGCIIRQVYQPALERGERLQAYSHRDAWWDLGTLEELARVDAALWRRDYPPAVLRLWQEVRRWSRNLL
ncbi:MAG TPA: NDP-sugar synthase [bacterium]|nr:NDP-sugar synthase [bacterium]